jgi:hypothetical protein
MVLLFGALRTVHCLSGIKSQLKDSSIKTESYFKGTRRAPPKTPFYTHISMDQIQIYQRYFDRALELSSTLEFERDGLRFKRLLAEASANDSLSEIDLEVMRLQYICADKYLREKYRSRWVETVTKRRDSDFFPDPWVVISAVFA